MTDMLITIAIWAGVAVGAWLGSRELDRAFRTHGAYANGPSLYPARPAR